MPLWVVVTIAAAAVQTVRFSLQKGVKGLGLSTGGSTFSRFLFAAPLAAAGSAVLIWLSGRGMPALDARFWAFAVAGGLGQIIATFCTVALFSERSFAVGIAFTKTETVQVALFSGIVLGDHISAWGFAAIVIGFVGAPPYSACWPAASSAPPPSATAAPRWRSRAPIRCCAPHWRWPASPPSRPSP
jgi:drug/metabolite transporter (DMT)-like permease